METLISNPKFTSVTEGIVETEEQGVIVLSPAASRPFRRIIYLDNYGGSSMWQKIKRGLMPPHHLRGCLELVRMGYEVALAEPLPDFYLHRNPLPHDLTLLRMVRSWLGSDGIIFCGHNVLYWMPLLRALGAIKCHIVSNLWAREPLNFARMHSGILSLTPAGAEQARSSRQKSKSPISVGESMLGYFPAFLIVQRFSFPAGSLSATFAP